MLRWQKQNVDNLQINPDGRKRSIMFGSIDDFTQVDLHCTTTHNNSLSLVRIDSDPGPVGFDPFLCVTKTRILCSNDLHLFYAESHFSPVTGSV